MFPLTFASVSISAFLTITPAENEGKLSLLYIVVLAAILTKSFVTLTACTSTFLALTVAPLSITALVSASVVELSTTTCQLGKIA